jgi:hypothetical protein
MDKGGVVADHCQVVPVEHVPSFAAMSPSTAEEVFKYIAAIRECFAAGGGGSPVPAAAPPPGAPEGEEGGDGGGEAAAAGEAVAAAAGEAGAAGEKGGPRDLVEAVYKLNAVYP